MPRTHFKHSKIDAFKIITPKFYFDSDSTLSGIRVKLEDQIVNGHLLLADNFSSVLNITGLSSLEAVAPYFVKQNKLTNITPYLFETNILIPLGYTYSDFKTSASFKTFLSGTLLPTLRPNSPTSYSHAALVDYLGWFYFLNTSGISYSPSTYVTEEFVNLYLGESLGLQDGIVGLQTYLWKNSYTSYFPSEYVSSVGTYTSGTQQLDKLITLTKVVYSELPIDAEDFKVRDAFNDYIGSKALLSELESKGPFYRLLKAISYSIHDIDNDIDQINYLYDLEKCPDQFLPLIAELIGWHLFGSDPNRWRLQLRNAVSLYKAKGTKVALQGAIDAIFSEGFLNLSGQINELYESYIPNLIFYSLATESPLLKDFTTWTSELATSLGIVQYSNTSMEDNIRHVVDSILEEVVRRFNSAFLLNGQPWDLTTLKFNYRGSVKPIPPFEEIKWYKNVSLSLDMINFIVDRIACFSVDRGFIDSLKSFILSKTIESEDPIELDNRWLFFYLNLNKAPNQSKLLTNFDSKRYKYIGLWSAKSSHFNLNLEASSFVYSNRSVDASSTVVLTEALRAINAFSPAHAIPDINFFLGTEDTVEYDVLKATEIKYETTEVVSSSPILRGLYSSGVNMSSLGRIFKRDSVDALTDLPYSFSGAISALPRTNQRRRNLHGLLPTNMLYTRTGFNAPVITQPSTVEYAGNASGYLPLGFIPSANKFTPVGDFSAVNQIYTKCENLSSNSTYSGVAVSNTYPSRGLGNYHPSSSKHYATRGDTTAIFGLITDILYKRLINYWRGYLQTSAGYTQYVSQIEDYDLSTSLANSSFGIGGFSSYENFEFSSGVHKVYNDWVKYFSRSKITFNSLALSGGNDIFSHIYGPLVNNGKFDVEGSALTVSANLITSSYSNPYLLNSNSGSGVFSLLGSTVGTFGRTSGAMHFSPEYVNSSILDAVELVIPSGLSQNNSFVIYNINATLRSNSYSNYAVKNPIVKMKNDAGALKAVYRLSAKNNKFIPEHQFSGSIKYFAGKESGQIIGGDGLAVWIHTEPVNNMVWSWNPLGRWELTIFNSSRTSIDDINQFLIKDYYPLRQLELNETSGYVGQCYSEDALQAAGLTLENITNSYFRTLTFTFNTDNVPISIPQEYFKVSGQAHTINQQYVVEVIKLANPDINSYILLDEVSIIDSTLNSRVSEYTPKQVLTALLYFKSIADSKASRLASITSAYYGTSGGSRLNYREHTFWGPYVTNPNNYVSSIEIIN